MNGAVAYLPLDIKGTAPVDVMRIAILHPFLYRYARGIERFTLDLANELAARRVEIELLTWKWQNPISLGPLDPRVRVTEVPTSRYYASRFVVPFYVRELVRKHCDLVWIFFPSFGEAAALRLLPKQPFGIVLHYPYEQVPHHYEGFRKSGLAARARHVVAVSEYVGRGSQRVFGRRPAVIHHGVDTTRFAPDPVQRQEMRAKLEFADEEFVILTAAALEERKGIQWVLDALPQVLNSRTVTYLVLGEGAYRETLERRAQKLGVEGHVRFMGAQREIESFYRAADLGLILSHGEASSLFALEALACELPMVAAAQPPFDELIAPAYGELVAEEDSCKVACAILELAGDPARREQMGRIGRNRIAAKFSWERAAEQYYALAAET